MTKMSRINSLKSFASSRFWLSALCLTIPLAVSLTACTGDVSLGGKEASLANEDAIRVENKVLFPDSNPSVADGRVYWTKQQCGTCHGIDGKGVPGKCDQDLTNVEWMRQRKPVDQYLTIAFGTGREMRQPTLEQGTAAGSFEPEVIREFKHPAYHDKLNRRQLWDAVFYSRALAVPLLSQVEHDSITPVFGGNCAVCHGTRGAGDGPLSKGNVLEPMPANFNQYNRFYDRTDEQIWDHIANGIKWEGMPNFLGKEDKAKNVKFDADYIWKLTSYIRSFHENADYALEGDNKLSMESPTGVAAPPAKSTDNGDKDKKETKKDEAGKGEEKAPEAASGDDKKAGDAK